MSPISLGLASGDGLLIRSPVLPWLLGFFMLEAVLACSLNFGWGSVQGITRCSKEKQVPKEHVLPLHARLLLYVPWLLPS